MAALTQARMSRTTTYKILALTLATGQSVFQGGIACLNTATGTVQKPSAIATLIRIGEFAETQDNTAGLAPQCLVNLEHEVHVRWYANDVGGGAVTAAMIGSDVYMLDDQTVTATAGTNSKAGRVWAVDSINGVAVEAYTL